MEAARTAVLNYLVSRGELYKAHTTNSRISYYICRDQSCPFMIRIATIKEAIILRKLVAHQCPITTHVGFRQASSVKYLKGHFEREVREDREMKPRTIQRKEHLGYGNQISYAQAFRTKKACRQDIEGGEAQGFQKILPLLNALANIEDIPDADDVEDLEFMRLADVPSLQYCGAQTYFHRNHVRISPSYFTIQLTLCPGDSPI